MDVLIALAFFVLVVGFVTKRFAPKRWEEFVSKFKK
tara:strand:- start:310 stop:417 length:108 start_codon:yes stop_codon:yes gene_type:complete